jgi:hypothetical protein
MLSFRIVSWHSFGLSHICKITICNCVSGEGVEVKSLNEGDHHIHRPSLHVVPKKSIKM